MKKMGGMGGIMGMMPGMGKMKDQMAAAGLDDKMFDRQIAIISSMTKAERANPDMLKHSRKKRIAAGSGTDAAEINKLLKMHRQMADMMKAMGGKGKGGGMMRGMMGGLANKMGLGGMVLGGMGGGMPDLSKMDPKQLEALQKQAEAAGLGGGMPKAAGPGRRRSARPRRPEAAGPGRPARPAEEEVRGEMTDTESRRATAAGPARLDRQYRCGADPHAGRTLPLHQGGRRPEGRA